MHNYDDHPKEESLMALVEDFSYFFPINPALNCKNKNKSEGMCFNFSNLEQSNIYR